MKSSEKYGALTNGGGEVWGGGISKKTKKVVEGGAIL